MSKRKLDSVDSGGNPSKRTKLHSGETTVPEQAPPANTATPAVEMEVDPTTRPVSSQSMIPNPRRNKKRPCKTDEEGGGNDAQSTPTKQPQQKAKHKVRKLVPPRPFPTVPASVSATGPRSAHTAGKNYICITRRTELGAYLRRCKEVFLNDG